MNADGIHRLTLDTVADRYPELALSDEEKDDLTDVWHSLQAWPDANPAIQRLRSKYTVVVLTVLSFGIVVESSKHSGIDWDAIISCEFLEHYKPDTDAYLDGLELLGLEPHEAMMVAAHKWDLLAAKEAGLATAYVPRPLERGENTQYDATLDGVDINAAGLRRPRRSAAELGLVRLGAGARDRLVFFARRAGDAHRADYLAGVAYHDTALRRDEAAPIANHQRVDDQRQALRHCFQSARVAAHDRAGDRFALGHHDSGGGCVAKAFHRHQVAPGVDDHHADRLADLCRLFAGGFHHLPGGMAFHQGSLARGSGPVALQDCDCQANYTSASPCNCAKPRNVEATTAFKSVTARIVARHG